MGLKEFFVTSIYSLIWEEVSLMFIVQELMRRL